MNQLKGWKIARIRGVDIQIHFSLVFLLFYVFLVANAQFPWVVKQSGIDQSLLLGSSTLWSAAFTLGLFFSILVHELGHVWVAQTLGVKVSSITLMILGGVSAMDRIPEQRLAEFKISIVGPLVSLGIAGLLFGLKKVTVNSEIAFFSFWLGQVNLVLGVFNLLPALPLDGGRSFRSLLAARVGTVEATATAVRVAQGTSWVLGFLGLISFNFILVFIAIFVFVAANQELAWVQMQRYLKGVLAKDLICSVPVIGEEDSVAKAAEVMFRSKNRILPVSMNKENLVNLENRKTIGNKGGVAMITLGHLKSIPKDFWAQTPVKQVMVLPKLILDPLEPIEKGLAELTLHGALPVQKEGEILGLVRDCDLKEFLDFSDLELTESSWKRVA
jgi:Zn-dependent protease/CBS domain-containing protein